MNGRAEKGIARALFYFWQFTWALPVNIFGLIGYLILSRTLRHMRFHNDFITFVPGNWACNSHTLVHMVQFPAACKISQEKQRFLL